METYNKFFYVLAVMFLPVGTSLLAAAHSAVDVD